MRSLTPEIWAQHHTDLADDILQQWPTLTRTQLQSAGADFDAVAEMVAGARGVTVDQARRDLLQIEVDERGLGTSDPGQTVAETPGRASLAQLRLGTGFTDVDRERITRALGKLDRRLVKFPADATELEISVKNRGETDQSVTLEAWLPNLPHFAVSSHESDLRLALVEVRDRLWRQIDDALGRRRPYQ